MGIAPENVSILAIDPGTDWTAWVYLKDGKIDRRGFHENANFLHMLRMSPKSYVENVAVEMIASYGMPVGADVFETCKIIGRIAEIVEGKEGWARMIYRKDVKMHLCQSMRAKDGNIRQALIDRLGPQGTKKAPGPTYGISKHLWAALAVAVYALDTTTERRAGA